MSYMPATLVLMNETITSAQTAAAKIAATGLTRAKALALHCKFTYGSGGTSAKVYVQTSFDQGTTWIDIACFAHTTSSLSRVFNLSALTPLTTVYTATDGSLTDDTAKDGLVGERIRVKFTSTGTYAGSTTCTVYAIAKD